MVPALCTEEVDIPMKRWIFAAVLLAFSMTVLWMIPEETVSEPMLIQGQKQWLLYEDGTVELLTENTSALYVDGVVYSLYEDETRWAIQRDGEDIFSLPITYAGEGALRRPDQSVRTSMSSVARVDDWLFFSLWLRDENATRLCCVRTDGSGFEIIPGTDLRAGAPIYGAGNCVVFIMRGENEAFYPACYIIESGECRILSTCPSSGGESLWLEDGTIWWMNITEGGTAALYGLPLEGGTIQEISIPVYVDAVGGGVACTFSEEIPFYTIDLETGTKRVYNNVDFRPDWVIGTASWGAVLVKNVNGENQYWLLRYETGTLERLEMG